MENRRARRRRESHPPHRGGELDVFETQRAQRAVDWQRIEDAYAPMTAAEEILYRRWEQQAGAGQTDGDPVGQLLSHPVSPDNADQALWLLGLGEKVAALGGHLQVTARFDEDEVTLITEPGLESQPPILGSPERLSELTAFEQYEMSPGDPDAVLEIELTADERAMILAALIEWDASAHPTPELAVAMGFTDLEDLGVQGERLIDAVQHGRPLIAFDWKRVLICTEIAFGSDYFGAGAEWETVTGEEDWISLRVLRGLQDKLIGIATHAEPPTDDAAGNPPDDTPSDDTPSDDTPSD